MHMRKTISKRKIFQRWKSRIENDIHRQDERKCEIQFAKSFFRVETNGFRLNISFPLVSPKKNVFFFYPSKSRTIPGEKFKARLVLAWQEKKKSTHQIQQWFVAIFTGVHLLWILSFRFRFQLESWNVSFDFSMHRKFQLTFVQSGKLRTHVNLLIFFFFLFVFFIRSFFGNVVLHFSHCYGFITNAISWNGGSFGRASLLHVSCHSESNIIRMHLNGTTYFTKMRQFRWISHSIRINVEI